MDDNLKQFILYTAPSGEVRVSVLLQDETVWLNQKAIAELFGVQRPAITKHLINIFDSGELEENSVSSILEYTAEDGKKYAFVAGTIWFTNIDHGRRHHPITLMNESDIIKFSTKKPFDTYENYDAIEVPNVKNIPSDYEGIMGVPISFLGKYSPDQFEIIWQASGNTRASAPKEILERLNYRMHPDDRGGCSIVNGKRTYDRIFIKHRK